MSKFKLQHFVPKCYLRPFCKVDNKKSINLFNLRRGEAFFSASIKGQCARNFFYDRTGQAESLFSPREGKYSEIVKNIVKYGKFSSDDLEFIRAFAFLQHLRTEETAKQQTLALSKMHDFVFDGDPEGKMNASIDQKSVPSQSLSNFIWTMPFLAELKDCIVYNNTKIPFITSDNPGILLNRYHIQKGHYKFHGTGIMNSGTMLILPLSPIHTFVSYDPGIYYARLNGEAYAVLEKPRDVEAINCLQVIRAAENIYFHDEKNLDLVSILCEKFKGKRRDQWFELHYATADSEQNSSGWTRYSVVHSPEDFRKSRGLIHFKAHTPDPGIWCSTFRFQQKPRYYDTRSGLGLIRSSVFLDAHLAMHERRAAHFHSDIKS